MPLACQSKPSLLICGSQPQRSHTKVSPYTCPDPTCPKVFTVESNRRRHCRLLVSFCRWHQQQTSLTGSRCSLTRLRASPLRQPPASHHHLPRRLTRRLPSRNRARKAPSSRSSSTTRHRARTARFSTSSSIHRVVPYSPCAVHMPCISSLPVLALESTVARIPANPVLQSAKLLDVGPRLEQRSRSGVPCFSNNVLIAHYCISDT